MSAREAAQAVLQAPPQHGHWGLWAMALLLTLNAYQDHASDLRRQVQIQVGLTLAKHAIQLQGGP